MTNYGKIFTFPSFISTRKCKRDKMVYCQNCGQENEMGTNFCRFCGNAFSVVQTKQISNDEYSAPRPYMWKTDEFQIREHSARRTQEINFAQPVADNPGGYNSALVIAQANRYISGYRCPRCGTTNLPFTKRQISTAGWITFSVLLVMTGILFWIGLLIREDVKVCSVCNYRISPN